MTDRQTKWLSPRSLIFLSVLFLCFATVGLRADSDDPCSSSAILSELHSYYPVPISASPDGALILAAAEPERESDNGLVVIDAKTRNVIKSLKWSEPMIHILWKPGGQAVSFFSQESGTNLRHLIVWDLKDGSTREIPTLATFNQPHVFWSPDGTKLAYSQETKAIVIVSAGETAKPVVYPGKFAIFAWSCDSQHLALVPDDNSHQILLANASSSRVIQTITTKDDGKVVDISWQPRPNMLLLQEHKDGSRSLIDYDVTKGVERTMSTSKGDMRSPAWLPAGQGYIFQRLQNGTGDLLIGSEQDGVEPRRLALDGINDFRGVLTSGNAITVTHRSAGPIELLKLYIDTGRFESLAKVNLSVLGTIVPNQVFTNSSDGTKIPLLVWRSQNTNPNGRAVVVRVHANLHGAEVPVWEADIQMYLKHGVDFIGVNYRGSSGYGSEFEKTGTSEQRARDVIAACDYAHSTLGIPYERVVVLGQSNGATIALGAGLIQPDHMGVLVLASLLGLPQGWQTYGSHDHKRPQVVLGLHGEKDRQLPPSIARAMIEKALGEDVFPLPTDRWRVLPDEDHVLHLDSSSAMMHSMVLRELGVTSCAQK